MDLGFRVQVHTDSHVCFACDKGHTTGSGFQWKFILVSEAPVPIMVALGTTHV